MHLNEVWKTNAETDLRLIHSRALDAIVPVALGGQDTGQLNNDQSLRHRWPERALPHLSFAKGTQQTKKRPCHVTYTVRPRRVSSLS